MALSVRSNVTRSQRCPISFGAVLQVDKIMKLNVQLAETKELLHQTIDKVLERGEKLDDLVDKSATLSAQSKLFYKQAKKTNSCCIVM